MANLITIARLLLLFVAIGMIYWGNATVILFAIPLIAIVFAGDGLDGYVARKRRSTSQFGAVFDIAGDRIVENAFWIIFAELQLIPVWIPLLVMTRGFVVDGVRSIGLVEGRTPFGENNMMRSALTKWLTAGRFMRNTYANVKALGFLFLTGLVAYDEKRGPADSFIYQAYGWEPLRWVGWACVTAAVTLTVVRGLPVIYDASELWNKPTEPQPGPDEVRA